MEHPGASVYTARPCRSSRPTTSAASCPTSSTRRARTRIGRATARFLAHAAHRGRARRAAQLARALRGAAARRHRRGRVGRRPRPGLRRRCSTSPSSSSARGGRRSCSPPPTIPAQYNGFKLCREHAIPIGEASGSAGDRARSPASVASGPPARARAARVAQRRRARRLRRPRAARSAARCPRLRVAIDCGNGMAAVGLEPLLARAAARGRRGSTSSPTARFPNHEADPLKLENLRRRVRGRAPHAARDFGVAFDGDARPRRSSSTSQAQPIASDLITALLARAQLRRHPGGRVLYDLRSSRATAEEIAAAGGVAGDVSRGPLLRQGAHARERARSSRASSRATSTSASRETLVADDGIAAFVALLDVLARRAPAALGAGRAAAALRRERRDQPARAGHPARCSRRIEAEHAGAPEISHLDGLRVALPGLVVQPAAVEHRAGAAAQSRGGERRARCARARRAARARSRTSRR